MLRRIYNWTIEFADHRYAVLALALLAFVESSFFPIPPEALLIPMLIAAPHRALLFASVCTIASVLGGGLGYYIGAALYEALAQPILDFYHMGAAFVEFSQLYNTKGHWAVLIGGLSPFPYKVITLLSGATGLNFWAFMLWSLLARGIRYFIIAGLLWYFGQPIRDFIERHLGLVFCVALLLLLGGFALIGYG